MLVVICGGGPGGAVAAQKLAQSGVETILLEKNFTRIKPCGGAIPPALVREFDIPEHIIERRVQAVTVYAPSGQSIQLDTSTSFVGMVNREAFDSFLRDRAAQAGALIVEARVETLDATELGAFVTFTTPDGRRKTVQPDCIIGADGVNSLVARKLNLVKGGLQATAVQERFALKSDHIAQLIQRCEIYYDGRFSPDFYSWVYPKADHVVIGTATTVSNANVHIYLETFKQQLGIHDAPMLTETAQIPLRPLKSWTANRTVLIGDAAGLAAPTSGEGIYYAMKSGAMAAEAILECSADLRAHKLEDAYQKRFMKEYGATYRQLEALQTAYYQSDEHREALVHLCTDASIRDLAIQSYLFNKRLSPVSIFTSLKLKTKNAVQLTRVKLGHFTGNEKLDKLAK